MKILLGAAIVVVLIIILVCLESRRKTRKIEIAFSGRRPVKPEQFYDRYFKAKGIPFYIVDGVRIILEEQLSADIAVHSFQRLRLRHV